jgi:hypothetical protein
VLSSLGSRAPARQLGAPSLAASFRFQILPFMASSLLVLHLRNVATGASVQNRSSSSERVRSCAADGDTRTRAGY